MPYDADNSRTYGDLMLDLAVRVNQASFGADGTSEAALPTDAETLRRLESCVREALSLFLRSDKNWSFMFETVSITFDPSGQSEFCVGGDAGIYLLPAFVTSGPVGNWRYADSRTRLSEITTRSWQEVMRYRNRYINRGLPRYSGFKALEPAEQAGLSRSGMKVNFWPIPAQAYTIEAEFRVSVPKVIDLADRHPCGADHDDTILKWAEEVWREMDETDSELYLRVKAARLAALEQSQALDSTKRTRRHGPKRLLSGADRTVLPRSDWQAGKYNGNPWNG